MAETTEEIDRERLLALFDMAGPETARELASRLEGDLCSVSRALQEAESGPDHQVLRAQSHVLIAISGTVGAERLTDLARQLNAMAHASGSLNPAGLIAEIQVRLKRLIQDVRLILAQWAGA